MMTCEQFACEIVKSGDLDPDYIFLVNVFKKLGLNPELQAKWVTLKTVVYNSISEAEIMFGLRSFEQVEYGAERRKHKRFGERFFNSFSQHAIQTSTSRQRFFERIGSGGAAQGMKDLQRIDGVGPWAAWKCLDLCERVLNIPIRFEGIDFRSAYTYPLKGVLMLNHLPEEVSILKSDSVYSVCLKNAIQRIGRARELMSPPARDRLINIQEFETIFCKYHSYAHGHYTPGEDLHRLQKRLRASAFQQVRDLEDCLP